MSKIGTFIQNAITAGFLALAPLSAPQAVSKEQVCFEDWTQAGSVVRDQSLTPPKDVRDLAKGKVAGELVKMMLCEEDGRYVYKLVLFERSGRLHSVIVDARQPFKEYTP